MINTGCFAKSVRNVKVCHFKTILPINLKVSGFVRTIKRSWFMKFGLDMTDNALILFKIRKGEKLRTTCKIIAFRAIWSFKIELFREFWNQCIHNYALLSSILLKSEKRVWNFVGHCIFGPIWVEPFSLVENYSYIFEYFI